MVFTESIRNPEKNITDAKCLLTVVVNHQKELQNRQILYVGLSKYNNYFT